MFISLVSYSGGARRQTVLTEVFVGFLRYIAIYCVWNRGYIKGRDVAIFYKLKSLH
jgi:hypothetical protein